MTTLSLVKTFCQRTGLPSPSTVASSQDAQVVQILALLNEVCEDLCTRWTWEALTKEALFTTVNGSDQGAIKTIAPSGFISIVQETIFNRTLRLPLFGPLSASRWQALKALPTTGPFYKYRIRGGNLLFEPAGIAGHTCAFEYKSSWMVLAEDGLTYKAVSDSDNDTFLLDEMIVLAGLRWKWKYEKGLDYAEELRRYEELAGNAAGRDATKPRLNMGEAEQNLRPGIWVPSGNWNVT